jgi:hypothetical protein
MPNAAQYRAYAQECRELAQNTNGEKKEALLKIAEAWERCADEIALLGWPTDPKLERFGCGQGRPIPGSSRNDIE